MIIQKFIFISKIYKLFIKQQIQFINNITFYYNMLKKVACNTTNSAAIDEDGDLWVWGSSRYGLCGDSEQPGGEQKKSGQGVQNTVGADGKAPALSRPTKLNIIQENKLNAPGELSIYNLLDLEIMLGSPEQSSFWATHLSYGSYHAGVVCNDMSTNSELIVLPQAQYEILAEFKAGVLKFWKELEKQNLGDISLLQAQYNEAQQLFTKQMNASSGEPSSKAGAGSGAAGDLWAKLGGQNKGSSQDHGEIPQQLKIEYMLRLFFKEYLRSTFPLVPLKNLKTLMGKTLKMSFKDTANMNKLFQHLSKQSEKFINSPGVEGKTREHLRSMSSLDSYVNLKELRDQILQKRCSNGKLFMYGVANEGRLGVYVQELCVPSGEVQEAKNYEMVIKGFQLVQFPDPTVQVTKVQCGTAFTLVLSTQGLLYSWGFGKSGSLGLGEKSFTAVPLWIELLYSREKCQNMTDISCGSSHSLSVDSQGNVYSWGNGQGGRLGHSIEVGENSPRQIQALQGKFIKFIEAGDASSACITHDNQVYVWGSGQNGRLGNGTSGNETKPYYSLELKNRQIKQIANGTTSCFAILESGSVLAWGSSKNGKLGFPLSNGKNYELPKEVISLEDQRIYQIAAGPFHTLLLTDEGKMFSMGNSKDGKLGYEISGGGIVDVELPERIRQAPVFFRHIMAKIVYKQYPLFNEYDHYGKLNSVCKKKYAFEINQVKCGDNFQIFLTNTGELYSCGSNKYGQLGIATEDSEEEDDAEAEEKNEGDAENQRDGTQLASALQKKMKELERTKDQWQPMKVRIEQAMQRASKVKMVAVGGMHVLAILENNNGAYAWGKNKQGQLGTGQKSTFVSRPTKLKAMGLENVVKQIACGENHTVFLMGNGCVMTCGSNEFGQTGIYSDKAVEGQTKVGDGSSTPIYIEKQYLDNVDFIAAGRFHTIALRRQKLGDQKKAKEEDEESDQDHSDQERDLNEKVVQIDIVQDIYAWGRGYSGQLGIKNLKSVQWFPQKVKIKKDPKQKEEDQPSRFQMVTCGEGHTLVLAVNGSILYTGDKGAVGLLDKNQLKQNNFEKTSENTGHQSQFVPYFSQNSLSELSKAKIKFISSNISSKINFAITQNNEACVFGEGQPFTQIDPSNKYIYADSGRNFQTLVHVHRLPYTWGDLKNGKLGIDPNDAANEQDPCFSTKEKKILAPYEIPFFRQHLRDAQLAEHIPLEQQKALLQKYDRAGQMEDELDNEAESGAAKVIQHRFPIQAKLKLKNPFEFEKDLVQQDVDLIINFQSSLQQIYENLQSCDKQIRNVTMKAQDSIASRIETFPLPNINKLVDLESVVPKVILLNQQIYEVLFSLLQNHPCYLINWICGALKKEIDLFDFHPQAFQLEMEDVQEMERIQTSYQTITEQTISVDEICFLVSVIFGGHKTIRNDKRIMSLIMMISVKVLGFELSEFSSANSGLDYTLDDVLTNKVECGFMRLHRLVFQSQTANTAFTEEILRLIILKLHVHSRRYTDGSENQGGRPGKSGAGKLLPVFDYEVVIADSALVQRRADQLQNFTKLVLDEIILPNIGPRQKGSKASECKQFFTNEILTMTIKANEHLNRAVKDKFEDQFNAGGNKSQAKAALLSQLDLIHSLSLRLLFSDLFLRLQHLKPHDIIKIVGLQDYQEDHVINAGKKRNNFYFLGQALNLMFCGGKVIFSSIGLSDFKEFLAQDETNYRAIINEQIKQCLGKQDMLGFNQYLLQGTLEQAMEASNPVCTMQLRNIVYVHNQLVKYGEGKIYTKGWSSDNILQSGLLNNSNAGVENSLDRGSSKGSQEGSDDEKANDMDPVKMILDELGNQFIILRVYSKEFIKQEVLNKSINLMIHTRIFENYNELVKCAHCNAIVHEGILPSERIQEGLKMKKWNCQNKSCNAHNPVEMSLSCKKCSAPRPPSTLPADLIFPLFMPIDSSIQMNQYVTIAEKVFFMVKIIDVNEDLEEKLKGIKNAEKSKKEEAGEKDFEKINLIDSFLEMRANAIQARKSERDKIDSKDLDAIKAFERQVEEALFSQLVEKMEQNIERRLDHQELLEKFLAIIRDVNEKAGQQAIKSKRLLTALQTIQRNAKYGIGSDQLLSDKFVGIYAGKLDLLDQDKSKNDTGGKSENKSAMETYFAEIDRKQTAYNPITKFQRILDENKGRRNIMKAQFGQFSSYPAKQLLEDGVVLDIKIGGKKLEELVQKCNYLFYELVADEEEGTEGGYKIELSFEEKIAGFCGLEKFLSSGTSKVGNNNQSILSSFVITDLMLSEMRRIMATKATVHLSGTQFNIYSLVKLINLMKTKSSQYAELGGPQVKKADNEEEEA